MADDRKDQRKRPDQRRRYPVGHDPRRESRQADADERAEARKERTREDQLALLDGRPGESARERGRI